jgi:hypothetical protein
MGSRESGRLNHRPILSGKVCAAGALDIGEVLIDMNMATSGVEVYLFGVL